MHDKTVLRDLLLRALCIHLVTHSLLSWPMVPHGALILPTYVSDGRLKAIWAANVHRTRLYVASDKEVCEFNAGSACNRDLQLYR
jgi:hypothetical protein